MGIINSSIIYNAQRPKPPNLGNQLESKSSLPRYFEVIDHTICPTEVFEYTTLEAECTAGVSAGVSADDLYQIECADFTYEVFHNPDMPGAKTREEFSFTASFSEVKLNLRKCFRIFQVLPFGLKLPGFFFSKKEIVDLIGTIPESSFRHLKCTDDRMLMLTYQPASDGAHSLDKIVEIDSRFFRFDIKYWKPQKKDRDLFTAIIPEDLLKTVRYFEDTDYESVGLDVPVHKSLVGDINPSQYAHCCFEKKSLIYAI